jgi:hypothetical protein
MEELLNVKYTSMMIINRFFSSSKSLIPENIAMKISAYMPIGEMLKNARAHGGSKDSYETTLGLFLNNQYVCIGCHDGGKYFKSNVTKLQWECKDYVTDSHKAEDEISKAMSGYGIGNFWIKGSSERIYVDMSQGVIYSRINVRDEKYNLETIISLD